MWCYLGATKGRQAWLLCLQLKSVNEFQFSDDIFLWELCCEWYSDSRLNIPLSCNSVANLVVLFCGIMELLAEKNGQLTERRETEFMEKRRKIQN